MKRILKRVKLSSLIMLATLPLAAMAQDSQVIRFGVDPTYPPFESKAPSGALVGFDIDLGNAICADLHAKCVWVEQNFDGIIPALKARKFDAIMSSMSATDVRRQQIDFSNRIYSGPSRLVARTGSKLQPSAEALQGKRIGVMQGTMQERYAQSEWAPKGVVIVAYQTQDQVYQDMVTNRLDAAFQAEVQADIGFLKTPGGKGFSFAGSEVKDPKLVGNGVAIGVRKDDPLLKEKIDRAIANIRHDGTYTKIAGKYFDFDIYGD